MTSVYLVSDPVLTPMPPAASALPLTLHRQDWRGWGLLALSVVLLYLIFDDSLARLVGLWETQPEYSFGYLIPFISAFLVWQRKNELERLNFQGSWWGPAMVILGLALWALGRLSTLDTLAHYAFVLVLTGIAASYMGRAGVRLIWVALVILLFMVPLPNYLLRELSGALQLISSKLGVAIIRGFGITVFLEGNVIDLGSMKLQVVEACDGLRYLFPLMTLGFIVAYFYRAPLWKRALVFLSTIPISVCMNSLRIGIIGVTVDRWGRAMAEGFLHDMEGWVVFMLCTALLVGEVWLLSRFAAPRLPMRDVFSVDLPAPSPRHATVSYRKQSAAFLAVIVALVLATAMARALPEVAHVIPARKSMSDFPMAFDGWTGRSEHLGSVYLDLLQLTDYVLATYTDKEAHPVNLYVSYYDVQSKGNSAHSPRDCIPGDGWEIQSLEKYEVPGMVVNGMPSKVNRVVIQRGETRQLVYYWFQQRGRVIAGEYAVKLYLFRDLLARQRSDGAMVRLVTPIARGEQIERAEERLQTFNRSAFSRLRQYIPE